MSSIGAYIQSDFELANPDNEICTLSSIMRGTECIIILFNPFLYSEHISNTISSLAVDINKNIDQFHSNDIRVICITREPPSTSRHWISDNSLKFEVYSDSALYVSDALVGTFDLSLYFLATKGVNLGSFFVSMPAILIVSADGKIISKYMASSPEAVKVSAEDVLEMTGVV